MKDAKTIASEPFLVKESATLNYVMCLVFFLMFVFGGITLGGGTYVQLGHIRYLLLVTIIPAIYFLAAAIHDKTMLEINDTGIVYKGNLITSWDNFVSADMIMEENPGSLSDDMRLVVQYYVPEKGMQYIIKLKMSAAMNKSEDQIIEAIRSVLEKRVL